MTNDPNSPTNPSKTEKLINLANRSCSFFHTETGDTYAHITVANHREIHRIDSDDFRSWLKGSFFQEENSNASDAVINEAISTLAALAKTCGKKRTVHRRVAKRKGRYYIDLGDTKWRVVKVDETGWRILKSSPVYFVRSRSMRPLPTPVRGGKFKRLLKAANLPDQTWLLVLAWMIECMRPDTPHVGLSLSGPQGSAKSSTQDFLKALIDPAISNRRGKPKLEDLKIAARNEHLLSYENLSGLSGEMQDALCTVLTGGQFGTRKKFSDGEEFAVQVKQPVLISSINNVVTQADLLDRFICIELLPITKRATETELADRFHNLAPAVFGAVLKWFSRALSKLPEVQADASIKLPRMADFAQLGEALARALKMPPGSFIRAYEETRFQGADDLLDDQPVGTALRSYMALNKNLTGTYGELSATLHEHWRTLPGNVGKRWCDSPKAFANALMRLQPALTQMDIQVHKGPRTAQGYRCTITRSRT